MSHQQSTQPNDLTQKNKRPKKFDFFVRDLIQNPNFYEDLKYI